MERLTGRGLLILQLLAHGYSRAALDRPLGGATAVDEALEDVQRAFGASSPDEAVAIALRRDLILPSVKLGTRKSQLGA